MVHRDADRGEPAGRVVERLVLAGDAAALAGGIDPGADVGRKWVELRALAGASDSPPLAHVQTFLAMSHDGTAGRMYLEQDRLRIEG